MASVTFKGSSYTYTATVPSSITIYPHMLDSRCFCDDFIPSVSLNKSLEGSFSERWFNILLKSGNRVLAEARYRLTLYKGEKKYAVQLIDCAPYKNFLYDWQTLGWTALPTVITCQLFTADGELIGEKTSPFTVSFSGFTPTVSISNTITSSINAQFGNVAGFCSGSVKVNSNGGTWKNNIKPPIVSSNLSGNGKSTTTINGTLNLGRLDSTSIPVTATVKNKLNGTKTASITLTTQAYSKPTVSGLSLNRGPNDYADIKFDYTLHGLNKTSNVTANITSGNATGYWKILDSDGNQVYPVSGWASYIIVSDGNTLANTSDTITEAISEELKSDQSYTLYAYVEDRLGETSQIMNYVLPTEYRTLDFLNGGKGAAFGKVSEYEGLDIAMDVFCRPLIGSVQMYAGVTAPNGWFICDGAPKNVDDYPELFEILQYRFGGSGNTFNLPDIRGRMPVGAGQGSGLTNRPLADAKGSEGIQQHRHSHTNPTVSGTSSASITGGSHHHSMTNFSSGSGTESAYMTSSNRARTSRNTSSETHTHDLPAHTHTFTGGGVLDVTNLPSGQTVGDSGNMPPYLGINFIIHAGRPTIVE